MGRGRPIHQYHSNGDERERNDQIWRHYFTQKESAAEKNSDYRGKEGKGGKETHRIAVNQLKPDKKAQKCMNDALIDQRNPHSR